MIKKLIVSVLALSMLSVLAVGSASETAEDKAAREARQAQAKAEEEAEAAEREAAIATLEADSTETATFVVTMDIDSRKPNRKHWDMMKGKPDPMVTITVVRTGRVLESEPSKDAFSSMSKFTDVRLNPDDKLMIVLEDSDIGMSDEVGTCDVLFSAGGTEYCDMGSGSVSIEFK